MVLYFVIIITIIIIIVFVFLFFCFFNYFFLVYFRTLKACLHRRFLSQQLSATQCNFCPAEVATSCDFIAILVQFVSVNVSTRLFLEQKLCAC